MTARADDIKKLMVRHLKGELSVEERSRLQEWVNADIRHAEAFNAMNDPAQVADTLKAFYQFDRERIRIYIEREIAGCHLTQAENHPSAAVYRVHFLKTAWFRWAAAIIILFGIGTYIFSHTSQPDKEVAQTTPSMKSNNVLPGSEKAILTLSNGQQIELSKVASETISDGSLSIENNNGRLSYQNASVVAINTMTTPKGGQYQLILADGTKVWLNAASSITYPTAFNNKVREVSITGEAYFEVKPNVGKPFIVKTTSDAIQVLGTSFNVNAYNDEYAVKTSLIEGSVNVNDTNIKPGQAYQKGNVSATNINQDVAWKNGYFDFNGMTAAGALKQIARWYNVEVRVKNKLSSELLAGKLGRDLNLLEILSALKAIGVTAELKGNILEVSSL